MPDFERRWLAFSGVRGARYALGDPVEVDGARFLRCCVNFTRRLSATGWEGDGRCVARPEVLAAIA